MREILTIIFEHKLLSDEEAWALVNKVGANAYIMGFLCFAVGIENGNKKIHHEEPYFLFIFTIPMRIFFNSSIDSLAKKRKINSRRVKELKLTLDNILRDTPVFLANQGWLHHDKFQPKKLIKKKSAFQVALEDLWEDGEEWWQEVVDRNAQLNIR